MDRAMHRTLCCQSPTRHINDTSTLPPHLMSFNKVKQCRRCCFVAPHKILPQSKQLQRRHSFKSTTRDVTSALLSQNCAASRRSQIGSHRHRRIRLESNTVETTLKEPAVTCQTRERIIVKAKCAHAAVDLESAPFTDGTRRSERICHA
jgi:hypothetical protein